MNDPAMKGSGLPRREDDTYDTIEAPRLVPALLASGARVPDRLWEPHAGAGLLVEALRGAGRYVYASDIEPRADDIHVQDFLAAPEMPNGATGIVMNPPYRGIDAHIRHALDLTEPVGGAVAVLARSELSHAASRVPLFRDCRAFDRRVELTWRPRWVEGTTGSPRHNFSWFCWDWQSCEFQPAVGWGVKPANPPTPVMGSVTDAPKH